MTIWTIGHSTRILDQFLHVLARHRIELLADVRRYPGSRRDPHFGRLALRRSLTSAGIGYTWIPLLGGRRRPAPDSPNTAWHNAMFRGYADYVGTESFAEGLWQLQMLAGGLRVCIMCAEAVWWRCHRGLIADVLRWQGYRVRHIFSEAPAKPHPYTSAARVTKQGLSYALPLTRRLSTVARSDAGQ